MVDATSFPPLDPPSHDSYYPGFASVLASPPDPTFCTHATLHLRNARTLHSLYARHPSLLLARTLHFLYVHPPLFVRTTPFTTLARTLHFLYAPPPPLLAPTPFTFCTYTTLHYSLPAPSTFHFLYARHPLLLLTRTLHYSSLSIRPCSRAGVPWAKDKNTRMRYE